MPFRNLPDSDETRQGALDLAEGAYKVYVTDQPDETKKIKAIPEEMHTQLVPIAGDFGKNIEARGFALTAQNKATLDKEVALKTLKMFNNHFIMVLNFDIARGKFHPSIRATYGLDVTQETLPVMGSEIEVFEWSKKLIAGEIHRIADGGAPMLDPDLAEMQAAQNAYVAAHEEQERKKTNYDLAQEAVEAMRPAVDKFIKKMWNTIEFYFQDDEPSSLRRKARAWGVVYATRPDEEPEPEPQTLTGTVTAGEKKLIMQGGFDVNTLFIVKNAGPTELELYTTELPTDPLPGTRVKFAAGEQKEVWANELGADTNTVLMVYNPDETATGNWEVTVGNPE